MSFAVSLTRSAPVPAAGIWPVLRDLTDALQAGALPATVAAGQASSAMAETDTRQASFPPFVLMDAAYLFHVTLRRQGGLTARHELLLITLSPHAAETRLHFEFIVTPRRMTPSPFVRRRYERVLGQLADRLLAGLGLDALASACRA
jgi:hypothetical protein